MKKYWRSIEEFENGSENNYKNEGPSEESLLDILESEKSGFLASRRDFLKIMGFSIGTAAIAASCENPIKKAIPLLNRPEEMIPGMANHYASAFINGSDYCSIVVKTRDGRPIKIEGNTLCTLTKGGTNARTQASILSLYDSQSRIKSPSIDGMDSNWETVDKVIKEQLSVIDAAKGRIVLLTSTIISPSTVQLIQDFIIKYPSTSWIKYDQISSSGILEANKICFDAQVIPSYQFDKADVIVGINADFLGTWLSPIEYTTQYSSNRKLGKEQSVMSLHYQFETGLSLTGSNADYRFPIKPSEEAGLLLDLYSGIQSKMQEFSDFKNKNSTINLDALIQKLVSSKGKSLVVSGSNDVNNQLIVNAINNLLQNYNSTIDLTKPLLLKQAIDSDFIKLVDEMNNSQIDALLIYNVNPAYDFPQSEKFIDGLKKTKISVSFASFSDETSQKVKFICPDNHYLESWNDAEPKIGYYRLAQPVINPLYNTRQFQGNLLKWADIAVDYYDYIQNFWESEIYKTHSKVLNFTDFWNNSLQDGVFDTQKTQITAPFKLDNLNDIFVSFQKPKLKGIEISLYESVAIGNGKFANNPWLQELPDPVSKVCWGNFAAVSSKMAKKEELTNGDMIEIHGISYPVLIQPGQADNTISIALGYGRQVVGKVGEKIGAIAYSLVQVLGNQFIYNSSIKEIIKTGKKETLALTQTHHSMEGRAIIRETSLESYLENPASGNEMHEKIEKSHVTLYKEVKIDGHHWGMGIDLNACTGCSSCVIGCQAENNIPVVGKEEVIKRRIMHWIRIDRYYNGNESNPGVLFQPIMCQHCDNAPCENVCPVSATMHSNEGLNQMAYNRCVGTKYCINNCPYKVRRFNWFRYATNKKFDFNMNDDLGRLVLNPDVVIRERGVVEKCSMCVQRIQEKKLLAKLENRILSDGEIIPACAQACPSKAIVFGNLNNADSEVSKLFADKRNYHLLEEIHTLPSVGYLTKVRNNGNKNT